MKRCEWSERNELYIRYHDEEWGVPSHDDRRHFEFLILEGAQAGLSWLTVLNKRENCRVARKSRNRSQSAEGRVGGDERAGLSQGL